jgi:hypothetical protein
MVWIWVVLATILSESEPMRLFFMGLSEKYSLQKQSAHNQHTETNFGSSDQHQLCEISNVSCRWSWMPMVHILKMFVLDCQSPKTSELKRHQIQ